MTRSTLDPKLDVVFKLLFAKPSNKRLLISLLTAILEPASPIVDVEVLDPEVAKETVAAKGTLLDLLVRLLDGRRVNLEIQASHVIELPKLPEGPPAPEAPAVVKWGKFLPHAAGATSHERPHLR